MKSATTDPQAALASAPDPEKLAYSIDEYLERVPFKRSFVYDEIRAGRLIAQKAGSRTLITPDNAKAHLASLPVVKPSPDSV